MRNAPFRVGQWIRISPETFLYRLREGFWAHDLGDRADRFWVVEVSAVEDEYVRFNKRGETWWVMYSNVEILSDIERLAEIGRER